MTSPCQSARGRCPEGISANGYQYSRCEECKLLYLDPLPGKEDLEKYYQQYRDVKAAEGGGYLTPGHLQTYRREKELTFRDMGFDLNSLRSKKMLEIGCANGPFLTLARDLGAEIMGIDIPSTWWRKQCATD